MHGLAPLLMHKGIGSNLFLIILLNSKVAKSWFAFGDAFTYTFLEMMLLYVGK